MPQLSKEEITSRLTVVFRDLFGDETIVLADTTTAKDIKGWDSFNHINLMMNVESEFKIRMKNSEITHLKNVGELIALISAKQA